MTGSPETSPQPRPRAAAARRQRGPRRWHPSPALVVLALAGLVALGAYAVSAWRAGRVVLTFVAAAGTAPDLELTIYSDRLSFDSPSPPPALATVALDGGLSATLDGMLVPGSAVVRYRGEGVGAGVAYVELGQQPPPIALEAPRAIRGRVGAPAGFWWLGWRNVGTRPVAGAEIIAMAGGEFGVDLARARTDEDGRFVLTGVAPSVHPLSLRVLASNYAIAHVEVPKVASSENGKAGDIVVTLERTQPLHGTISAPAELDVRELCIVARGLPGVQARPEANGAFVLDHVPAHLAPRLVVHGLGPFHGCPELKVSRRAEVRLAVQPAGVVRGSVVEAASGRRLAGAHVYSADGAAVQTDAAGEFELERVLTGNVRLTAQYLPPRKPRQRREPEQIGYTGVEVGAGQTVEGVQIAVAKR